MKKSIDILRILSCFAAAIFFWGGCDDMSTKSAQTQAVRKKVDAKTETGQPGEKARLPVDKVSKPDASVAPSPGKAAIRPVEPPLETQEVQPVAASVLEAASNPPLTPGSTGTDKKGLENQIAAFLNVEVPPLYNPNDRVDPFEPYVKLEGQQVMKVLKPKKRAPQSPLEQLDLGQLKLVAIIVGGNHNWAMVEESTGKGYTIKEGTYIGTNSGKVVDILADTIVIEEEFVDEANKTVFQKKELKLPKPPGEM